MKAFLDFIKPTDFIAVVKDINWMNDKVCSVWFYVVEGEFNFKAGQFVNLKFKNQEGEDIQRAYSVASAPIGKSGMKFELCVEIIEGGQAGQYFSNLKVGDECNFKGPFGFCTLPEEAEKAVLVGTGTGIAPIKGILENIKNKKSEVTVDVLFGFRYWKDGFYLETLDKLACDIKGKIWICLSRENLDEVKDIDNYNNLNFVSGRVTSLLQDGKVDLNVDTHLYICGGSNMIKEVRERGLDQGIDKRNIHVEIFD